LATSATYASRSSLNYVFFTAAGSPDRHSSGTPIASTQHLTNALIAEPRSLMTDLPDPHP
jgi:hypothetical protein